MPDVIEMPYTPRVVGGTIHDPASNEPRSAHLYRFGGPTCLAGDEIGTYAFDRPLKEGDVVTFEDMAIYSMVKNNTFNGINLPDIALRHEDGSEETLRTFGYDDFASRL
jgi:carboxynorspermidine decarboxylase